MFIRPATRGLVALGALSLVATGCSLSTEEGSASGESGGGEVVLVTHDSFNLPEELVAAFEEDTGYELVHTPAGDGGELTNKLVLTDSEPLGDVAFGVDNTFASRALDADVFAPYDAELPAGAEQHTLPGDEEGALAPIDTGNVCVNVDTAWFEQRDRPPPETLDDLTEPAYESLFVTPGATSSTPGMAFLLATIAEYGEDWQQYWQDLLANGAKIVRGWEDAYTVDFTYSGGNRPIVLSYDSSPAFTVADGETSTADLASTCFGQVEYAGVLAGAENPEGAQAVIDWMLSQQVQEALPPNMYVYPVAEDAALPEEWAEFAPPASPELSLPPEEIAANRSQWQQEWTDITTR
ncbi:thiamine ABC transporter substrate-binding protein [Nocardioides panacisoli]|uniref:thiamine ABC transporter substrate-binding protein n=1 Tax=Nocardioides panacisoli TaxID=627624 RepID=UPI001C6373EE|nr:thiamine ABC transporter substrate-binding protein [Nocardioides panacisoli]QYJ03710.1 thiamine ABC transporter substrate-binding protein [Nocardioides panacisoli]